MKTQKIPVWSILRYLFLFGIGALLLVPFFWMISVSFERYANLNPPFPPKFFPDEPSLFNYHKVLENGTLLKAYLNSFIVAGGTVLTTLITALPGGYAFSKGKFIGKKIIFYCMLATMMIPLESRLIPMYMMFKTWNLVNNFVPLIITVPMLGFSIMLTKQYFDSLPNVLREAAWIDGAGEITIFGRIFVPLSKPMVATLVILVFMGSWNDFLWPLVVLTSQTLQTVPIFLSKFSLEDGSSLAGLSMALSAMSIVPVVIFFLFFQKYIIQSVALSGIKGE